MITGFYSELTCFDFSFFSFQSLLTLNDQFSLFLFYLDLIIFFELMITF